jgi:hypothetical protein
MASESCWRECMPKFRETRARCDLHGAFADLQQSTDCFCALALHGERRDLPLAPCERPWPGRGRDRALDRFAELPERRPHLVTTPLAAACIEYLDGLAEPCDSCCAILRQLAAPQQSQAARPKGLVAATEE